MRTFIIWLCLSCFLSGLSSIVLGQHLKEGHFITTISKDDLNYLPGLTPQYDVDAYYILYRTISPLGDSTLASGLLLVPHTDTCNFFPLISYQHGTILKKIDVPSRLNGESIIGQIFCSLGNIAVCPDYLGLGDSPGLHPYCHGESEATATIDLIRASREFLEDSLQLNDNGEVFLTGYSQGGHATMATHKYIQEENLLTEFNIIASAPCSGPYNISGAQSEMIFNTPDYPSPGYLIFILFAYNSVYQNIFSEIDEILKSPYDVTIPPFLNGNYSTSQLNNALPDSLEQFLTDSFYQAVIDDMDDKISPIWQDLIDNDNHDWIPLAPVKMYYCGGDEQVSYMNSVIADSVMNANGASDVESIMVHPTYDHGDCGLPAIVNAYYWFNTLRTPCISTVSIKEIDAFSISAFPNPASDIIRFSGLLMGTIVECYDVSGKLCFQFISDGTKEEIIDSSVLTNGLYILNFFNPTSQHYTTQKLVIIR